MRKKFLGEIQAANTKMPIEKSSCLTECPLILTKIYGGKIRIEMACNRRYNAANEDEVDYIHCACLEVTWHTLHLEFWTEKNEQCAKRLKRIPTHHRLLCQNNHSLAIRNDGTFAWNSQVIVVKGGGVVLVFSTYLQIHLLQVYSRFNEELDEFLDKAIAFFDPDGRGFPCVDQKQTEVYNMQRRKVLCPDYYKTLYQMANEADSWHDPTGTMSLMERSYRALPPGTTLPASLKYRCKDFY